MDVTVHIGYDFLATILTDSLLIRLFELFDHVEIVGELIKLLLTQGRAQVDNKSDWNRVEYILVQILA